MSKLNLADIFDDKNIKQKDKAKLISEQILSKAIRIDSILSFADKGNEIQKATCLESLEFTSKKSPELIDEKCFQWLITQLKNEAPRVKWESSKTLANMVKFFPTKLSSLIKLLLINTEDKGTVVRWATSLALSEIIMLKTKHNTDLIPAIESILTHEEDTAIKKKYIEALKKIKNSIR